MSRSSRGGCALSALAAALLAGQADAADLAITGSTSSPVATATANNGPGNISVSAAGSINVSAATAATINSSNSLTNAGTISSSAGSNAATVVIDGTGGIAANLENDSAITATGTGSGNIGLLVQNGSVTGNITSGLTGSIAVAGTGATGALIAAPVNGSVTLRSVSVSGTSSTAVSTTAPISGNLTLLGSTSALTGSYGLLAFAPVGGSIVNGSAVTVGSTRATDTSGNVVAGAIGIAGIRIGASVGGGFVNDRYYVDATGAIVPAASVDTTLDTLITGAISTSGTAPALWIGTDNNGGAPITLGAVGTGGDAYAVINRGEIIVNYGNPGLAGTAVRIGGGGAATILAGGIDNQATAGITADSLDAPVVAVDLLSGASVPTLHNEGAIVAGATQTAKTSSTAAGSGGTATGIAVESGASLASIVNSGTLTVTAAGPNQAAAAIVDRSGTLQSIVNSGTITATATDGSQARAIDLSAGSGSTAVTNSGTITGDVVFGSGPGTLTLTAGSIAGGVSFGSAANQLNMSGTSVLTGTLSSGSPLTVSLADSAKLDLTAGPAVLNSLTVSGNANLIVPITPGGAALTVNGAASFTGASTVTLSLRSLALSQNLTIIQANGGLTTDHLATLIDASQAPFLFSASAPTLTANAVSVTLVRKSADQLGLSGGQAGLYDASITALANSPVESAAIANLSSQAALAAAYRQITPPSFGRAPLRVAQSVADSGFGAAAGRLAVVEQVRHGGTPGIGAWGQETGDFIQQGAGSQELGFKTSGLGLAGGVDVPFLGLDAVGIALLSNFTNIHENSAPGLATVPVSVTTLGVEPYLSKSWHALFFQAEALAAHVHYSSKRTLSIGGVTDTVTAGWNGMQYGAGLTAGARVNVGRFRVTPSDTISWTELRQGQYSEEGGGAFDLAVDRQTDKILTDTARLAVSYRRPLGDGQMVAEVHGAYVHDFDARATKTTAHYVAGTEASVDGSAAIALTGDPAKAGERDYGGDLGYEQDTLGVKLGYDRREATAFHDQAVTLTAGLSF